MRSATICGPRTKIDLGGNTNKRKRSKRMRLCRRLASVCAVGLAVALFCSTAAFAISTEDVRWFGWSSEGGGSHNGCGRSITQDFHYGESNTWFQGWGQSDPGCYVGGGDTVESGWIGARAYVYKNGSLCADTGWGYNSTPTSMIGYGYGGSCSGSGNFDTLAYHAWWGADCGCYAEDSNWSPILSL